ncbi:hypothetical protein Tco_0476259 [Tanacetum coccineum]
MLVDEEWMNVPITFPPVAAGDLSDEALVVEILRAISSTIHAMMKFPTLRGIATLVTQTTTIYECQSCQEQDREGNDSRHYGNVRQPLPDQYEAKSQKCSFGVEEGKFLGYMVTSEGIRANPAKTKDIVEMHSPKTWAQMQIIIEQIVKFNQKTRILELKQRYHEENCSDNLYAVSIMEDMAYPCPKLHSASTKRRSIRHAKGTNYDEKARFELKGQFLKELRDNAFSGTNGEDAVEHIEKFLKIVDSLDIPNVTHDQLRLSIFPISLIGAASKWLMDEPKNSITTWVDLTEFFLGNTIHLLVLAERLKLMDQRRVGSY